MQVGLAGILACDVAPNTLCFLSPHMRDADQVDIARS
jgi:hypothetical protein